MKRLLVPILVAVLGTALFTGLLYVSFYRSLDSRLYDLLLRIKPAIEEDKSILLLEVDDPTISTMDMYPLGRDIFADGLILLKEFGSGLDHAGRGVCRPEPQRESIWIIWTMSFRSVFRTFLNTSRHQTGNWLTAYLTVASIGRRLLNTCSNWKP